MAETTLLVSGGLKTAAPIILGAAIEKDQVVETPDSRQKSSERKFVGCGKTHLGQKIITVEPKAFLPCPDGKIGEIWVSGENVAQGYWNRPEETERTFRAYLADTGEGPFPRTGDLGFLQSGELFITGRIKDLIIIHGQNYYSSSGMTDRHWDGSNYPNPWPPTWMITDCIRWHWMRASRYCWMPAFGSSRKRRHRTMKPICRFPSRNFESTVVMVGVMAHTLPGPAFGVWPG